MDKNSLSILNSIIFQIYNIDDMDSMKKEVLHSLRFIVPFKCGSFLMAGKKSDGHILSDPVCLPENYIEMEEQYLQFEDRDFSSWLLRQKQSVVIRISTLMAEEERMKTEVYKNCFEPFGLHYSIDVTIASRGQLLGDLTLYRGMEDEDFTDEEEWIMRMLSSHLNARFYSNKYGQINLQKPGIGQIGNLIEKFGLTKREAEVLHSILKGQTNARICEELFISNNTLKKHLHNLYSKVGVTSRVQLLGIDSDRI